MKRLKIDCPSVGRVNKRRLSKGFTMAEVMIVVLIMGIVTIVGLPLLTTSMDHYKLKGAAQEVVNAFQYAQASAISSGRPTRVIIAPNVDQIAVRQFTAIVDLLTGGDELLQGQVEGGNYKLMEYPLKKGVDYQINFSDEDRFKGVDITVSDFDQSNPVDFDTMGHPSHGGTVTLSLGGQQMVISLDVLTGKASVN
jgi:prepilin-type N-terminal cleavage/methylation domain-containing protein